MPLQKISKDGAPPEDVLVVDPIEEQEEDIRYFDLAAPIDIRGTVLTKLLIDQSELPGPTFFKIVKRFRTENLEAYRACTNKLTDETFLSYVLAELNPPMTFDDVVQKVPAFDLQVIQLRMPIASFHSRTQRAEKTAK